MNDPKYIFEDGRIRSVSSGSLIPEDEPVMVFRAKDKHALAALNAYMMAAMHAQGSSRHTVAIDERIQAFRAWQERNPGYVKEPDTDITKTGQGQL